jgi:hypothetical protein
MEMLNFVKKIVFTTVHINKNKLRTVVKNLKNK